MSPARGVMLGALIGFLMWLAFGIALWVVLT